MDIKTAMQGLPGDLAELSTTLPGQTEPAYYKPMTLGLSDKIARRINAGAVQGDGEKLAITLALCVLDKDGNRVFDDGDIRMLMERVPQQLLLDIVNEVNEPPDIEAAEGN